MSASASSPFGPHWDRIYEEKDEGDMSWMQAEPHPSLELLEESGLPEAARVLDVGGGTSRLVDRLLDRGFRPGVLDVSGVALESSRARLAQREERVAWIHGSVLEYRASEPWDAWHDRAAFHFLVAPGDRERYVAAVRSSLVAGGVLVVATFGPDGPERCSGLPVCRHDPEMLSSSFGEGFEPERFLPWEHLTPWGDPQRFLYARFRRRG